MFIAQILGFLKLLQKLLTVGFKIRHIISILIRIDLPEMVLHN